MLEAHRVSLAAVYTHAGTVEFRARAMGAQGPNVPPSLAGRVAVTLETGHAAVAFWPSCAEALDMATALIDAVAEARTLEARDADDSARELLQRSADKASARRFTGGPITGFGAL